jgi:hypothetical protein
MAAETWLDATEALALGFADRIAEPVRIAASFDIGRFRNAPPALADAVAAEPEADDAQTAANAQSAGDAADTNETDSNSDSEAEDRTEADLDAALAPDTTTPAGSDPGKSGVSADTTAIRASAIAHARAVVDLCRLAGQPQMAGRFLETDAGLEEVRAALLAAKAEAEPEIAAHHPQPGRSSAARPWGEIVARTFRPKG